MRKIIVIALVACLAASTAWLLLREGPRAPISEEEAIAKIKTYLAGAEEIQEENIRINRIELRPPTESEFDLFIKWGEEPPELMWSADVTQFFNVGSGAGIIWLDTTGEIIYGCFID